VFLLIGTLQEVLMRSLTAVEIEYLTSERRLGRLATADGEGHLHVVPIGMWRFNPETGTIDVSGHNFDRTRKFRNVSANPRAAFVVDDLASTNPWRSRSVMIEGPAEAIEGSVEMRGEGVIRISPETVVSWGLEERVPTASSG
jgi:pyridoxamine 5'-phosphate oxidase family protein